MVSQLPRRWIPFSKRRFRCFAPRAVGLLDWIQVNVFEVVSRHGTDDRITLPHPTVRTKHKLSSVEKRVERTKNTPKDLPYNLSIVDLLFLHRSYFSMSFEVIFRNNGKKRNNDAYKIWRLGSNRRVDVSGNQMYSPFLLVDRIVCKMCLVWTAEKRDYRSSKRPP